MDVSDLINWRIFSIAGRELSPQGGGERTMKGSKRYSIGRIKLFSTEIMGKVPQLKPAT